MKSVSIKLILIMLIIFLVSASTLSAKEFRFNSYLTVLNPNPSLEVSNMISKSIN